MAPPEYDGTVHRQLGELIAGVENLKEAFRRSEEKSDASRASVHRRMDDMVDRIGKVEGTMLQVNEDVTEMKPVTDDVRRWKLMGMGALGVVGITAAALGVTFADVIKRFLMMGRF